MPGAPPRRARRRDTRFNEHPRSDEQLGRLDQTRSGHVAPERQPLANHHSNQIETNWSDVHAKTLLFRDTSVARGYVPTKPRCARSSALTSENLEAPDDRNPVNSRERTRSWPPLQVRRCSRGGRSPKFVSRIFGAIMLKSAGLSQPRCTWPCHSGTSRCSRHTRPPRHGYDAGKCLIDSTKPSKRNQSR